MSDEQIKLIGWGERVIYGLFPIRSLAFMTNNFRKSHLIINKETKILRLVKLKNETIKKMKRRKNDH